MEIFNWIRIQLIRYGSEALNTTEDNTLSGRRCDYAHLDNPLEVCDLGHAAVGAKGVRSNDHTAFKLHTHPP